MTSHKRILEIINRYSLNIFYLITHNKMPIGKLYEAILSNNKEIILKEIYSRDKKNKFLELKEKYTKRDCVEEILYLTDNRYRHLKEIKDLVDVSDIIDNVITNSIYEEKVKIHYTDLIIDLLVENYYDYRDLKVFSKCREHLITLDHKQNIKIMGNIDRYYIRKITI